MIYKGLFSQIAKLDECPELQAKTSVFEKDLKLNHDH